MGNGSWVGSLLGQDRVEQRGKNSQTPGRPPEVGGGGGGGPAAPPDHRSRHRSRRKRGHPKWDGLSGADGSRLRRLHQDLPLLPRLFRRVFQEAASPSNSLCRHSHGVPSLVVCGRVTYLIITLLSLDIRWSQPRLELLARSSQCRRLTEPAPPTDQPHRAHVAIPRREWA